MLALPWILVLVFAAQSGSAANYSLPVDPGMCVQVQAGDSSTPASDWSMSSSGPFLGRVDSSLSYSYGPTIRSSHTGRVPGPGNYFFSACNTCPGSGTMTVDFQLPDPPIGGGPSTFPSPDPGNTADCSASGFGDISSLAGGFGPLGFVIALVSLIIILGLPAPAQAQRAPGAGGAWPPPRLVPTPWLQNVQGYQIQEGPAPPPMAGPGPRLQPTPWIGVWHRVPADAPSQFPPGVYPPGYPFPQGTWSKMTCPGCGQLTLSPFKDGWFCTNLLCPLRTGNTTEWFVSKEWYGPGP